MGKYAFTIYPNPARPDDMGSVLLAMGSSDGGAAFNCYAIAVRELGPLDFTVSPGGSDPKLQALTDKAAEFVQALQAVQCKH